MASSRLSLRTIVFIGGATLMLVPAIVTATLYTAALQQRGEELQVEKLTTRGELSANLLARRTYGVWMDVAKLASLIDPANLANAREQIQFMSRLDGRYSWLGIADVGGKVLTAKDGMLEGESVAERPWFRRGLEAPTAIDVHEAQLLANLLPKSQEPYRFIDLAAPLRHAGSVAGVVGAQLNWNWVAEGMAALQAPGIDVLLVSQDRTVLFGPPDLINKPLNIGSALAASRVTTAFLSERWPDGKDYFTVIVPTVGFADLPSFGWSLLVRQNADAAMASTRELIRSFWLILGAGALAALALLFLAAQWLRTPLRRLSESAETIVQDPASRPPYQETRFDEAARLSDALARIQSKLMRAASH
ncbi:cache domain-containing protein [Bradyrhizobium sp. CB1650]|uniref:cache domain-containing protein n=1 Tax=Bradyrhizobium sp. CB1650 TaxID=3039153 RepID=UPI002434A43E|nr:cache domain-containing protein [Bradyrhizobium sp. CB1650]WGD53321.1 cache domain-containing protein [Bradyrhizobium sp. CB1650]